MQDGRKLEIAQPEFESMGKLFARLLNLGAKLDRLGYLAKPERDQKRQIEATLVHWFVQHGTIEQDEVKCDVCGLPAFIEIEDENGQRAYCARHAGEP